MDFQNISEAIREKRIKRIKLLGDSITHGVGGTDCAMDGEIIVDDFSRNPNGYCWAKLFKEHLQEKYGCAVVNNACSGTTIQFILQHFDTLVDEEDDLIICTIGTNNRHQDKKTGAKKSREEFGESFYNYILQLNNIFQKKGKNVIFVSNIPAASNCEQDGQEFWRILHMDDINHIYKAAHAKAGFLFISLFDLFTEYLLTADETVDEHLKDGLHPNDKGYRVIFELLCNALQI